MKNNFLKEIRESLLLSKAELAKKANVSPITISRIENGMPCRLETKRKLILALGYDLAEKNKIFSDYEEIVMFGKKDHLVGLEIV